MRDTVDVSSLLLRGIGLKGYRSFYSDMAFIHPMSRVTVVAGANNAGKSNLLRFFYEVWPRFDRIGPGKPPISPLLRGTELPRHSGAPQPFAMALPASEYAIEDAPERPDDVHSQAVYSRLLKFEALKVGPEAEVAWILLEAQGAGATPLRVKRSQVDACIKEWGPAWTRDFRQIRSHVLRSEVSDPSIVMNDLLVRLIPNVPKQEVVWIGVDRRLDSDSLARLDAILRPTSEEWDEAKRLREKVTRFVRNVFDDVDLELYVPHTGHTINIVTEHRTLDLESVGTGIRQVLLIALAATALDRTFVCIEEPELNLHPLLQRRLVQQLEDSTTNQYFLTTHSANLLNYERGAVVRLTYNPVKGSKGVVVREPFEHIQLCEDLGYEPADLLQSNSIIWVEGPSDRVYVNAWLNLIDADLSEGLHYSIMFYGGSLLAHLATADRVEEFVQLRRLNQRMAILMDSDKSSPSSALGDTKLRILEEYGGAPTEAGFAWTTNCRTIENYIARASLDAAAAIVHPKISHVSTDDRWGNPLDHGTPSSRCNKVAIARVVAQDLHDSDLDRWDLRRRIEDLAMFVWRANRMRGT